MPNTIFTAEHTRFVKALSVVRRDAGVTQAELSTALGRNQSYISNIERGQRRVDVIEFCEIARALGREPVELFTVLLHRAS